MTRALYGNMLANVCIAILIALVTDPASWVPWTLFVLVQVSQITASIMRYHAFTADLIRASRVFARFGPPSSIPLDDNLTALTRALRSQRQLDDDGTEVGVSRQACDEAAEIIDSLNAGFLTPRKVVGME